MGIFVKKRAPLISVTLICTLISVARLHIAGDVPIVTLTLGALSPFSYVHKPQPQSTSLRGMYRQLNFTQNCNCLCQSINEDKDVVLLQDNDNITTKLVPYVAPGPSQVQELVPMEILKKKVSISENDGLEYLDHTSLSHYYQCRPSINPLLPTQTEGDKQCHKRTFLGKRQPLTALVSFHGSGNTWVRYLLEQATGFFTGSIYCDGVLKVLFPGEFVVSGNVIAVKTHHADTRELPKDVQLETGKERYDRAIVVIRNPFDALVSEANRRWNSKRSINSHVGLADETTFVSEFISATCFPLCISNIS